ncbi:L-arabinose isomerase [Pectinatus haikarae]|uniref:L-arabinose isomerase n=1 Tax=Pectinatus haikarae TaxID=349096 RepID=A0ABT9Y9V8_9FIRM|nr:L-arabinose isomerase [Pectinatus haikarae]MDQ0204625.1 L-arabinose isomerase [Pectinatus haikarae]
MKKEFWFVVGSVEFYGENNLAEVRAHARAMADFWNEKNCFPYTIVLTELGISSANISDLVREANYRTNVAGIILWMHTFSPAKSWIAGLKKLQKPMLHLATQFNESVPWETIDMDFMNLNQSAHGDREFAFINRRLNKKNKIVAGYWRDSSVLNEMSSWMNTANTFQECEVVKIARFGDNMRNVADTEGDKVSAQIQMGWSTDYYGIGDLVEVVNKVSSNEVEKLFRIYKNIYEFDFGKNDKLFFEEHVKEQARIEIALRQFLTERNYQAFTTNFEDLHGMRQLPGLAVQRLMAEGFGFAGEGDWKTAALDYVLKILSGNQKTGFMEDYTYNFSPGNEYIVGAHMLEVDPTLAAEKPKVVVAPLGIGGREDPARLVFNGCQGKGVVASIIHLGNSYELIINEIAAQKCEKESPKLPVAKVIWKPMPSFKEGVKKWLEVGGGHHTVYSLALKSDQIIDLCTLLDLDYKLIN